MQGLFKMIKIELVEVAPSEILIPNFWGINKKSYQKCLKTLPLNLLSTLTKHKKFQLDMCVQFWAIAYQNLEFKGNFAWTLSEYNSELSEPSKLNFLRMIGVHGEMFCRILS